MTWGLTAAGFNRKRLPDIETEIKAAYEAAFSIPAASMTGDTVLGQLAGIQAERLATLWELGEAVYLSAYPDSATGVPLANAGALTGHAPLAAVKSTLTATVGTAGGSPVTLTVGRQAKVLSTGALFETIEEVIIPAGGTIAVEMRAVETGPTEAPAGTMTTIVTPVSGWDTVTNAADAVVGRNAETDAEFRTRRADELVISQGGIIEAMENRIRNEVDGVTFCVVQENRTSVEDGDGRPPHSVHVTVIGGTDADVAAMIWATHPAGADFHGSESAVVVDSGGNNQTVLWDRATVVRMYLIANLTTNADYPADGDGLVTAALAAHDDDLENGDDVVNWLLASSLAGIPGITGVEILQGIAPTPTLTNNTAIATNEVASIAAADIIVNS